MTTQSNIEITHGLCPGQVLQRNSENMASVDISGECGSAGNVLLNVTDDIGGSVIETQVIGESLDGIFKGTITGIPVGGPYSFEIKIGNDKVLILDVYVGDVWILAGQSNMQGIGDMDFPSTPEPKVRAFYLNYRWGMAKDPLHLLIESPDRAHAPNPLPQAAIANARKNMLRGVGLGVEFGKTMIEKSGGVPQGLICTAHGGTTMNDWQPAPNDQNGDTFYGSMLKSVRFNGQKVSGILWYQGESDTDLESAKVYAEKMHEFVSAVRRDIGIPTLPFFIVQLARNFPGGKLDIEEDEIGWRIVREEQLHLRDQIEGLEVVPALDLPLEDRIHLSSKGLKILGRRLARVAAGNLYDMQDELPVILFKSARRAIDKPQYITDTYAIDVEFDNVSGCLHADGEPHGFCLVDDEGNNYPLIYRTILTGKKVRLETSLTDFAPNLKLSYGWKMSTYCNIRDEHDMAIPAFGPVEIENTVAVSDFIRKWQIAELLQLNENFCELKCPEMPEGISLQTFTGNNTSIRDWIGKSGTSILRTKIHIAEPMKLDVRFAYDGPVRVWINRNEVFHDFDGTPPMGVDNQVFPWQPNSGTHEIMIAMQVTPTNLATGVRLRFSRKDLSSNEITLGDYIMPEQTI